MPITLHAATVAPMLQSVGAVHRLLGKARDFAAERGLDEAELIARRLAPDMLPFGYQVKSVAAHSIGAIDGCRAGAFSPDTTGWPQAIEGLQQKLDDAAEALRAVSVEEMEALVDRPMVFSMGEMRLPFTVQAFLTGFSLPNLYFHATTTYDLLRAEGMPLAKTDYLGRVPVTR